MVPSADQPYRILIEQMQEGAVTLAAGGTILYCNLRFGQMLALPHTRVLASSILSYVIPRQAEAFSALLRKGAVRKASGEFSLCTSDENLLPTYITVSPLPADVEGYLC